MFSKIAIDLSFPHLFLNTQQGLTSARTTVTTSKIEIQLDVHRRAETVTEGRQLFFEIPSKSVLRLILQKTTRKETVALDLEADDSQKETELNKSTHSTD